MSGVQAPNRKPASVSYADGSVSWLNLPNFLTLLRLVLTPFAVAGVIAGEYRRALAFFIAAGITDGLDGYLARRFAWQTRAGAYLDPVADKLLLTATYVALAISGNIPMWIMWLIVGRDAMILTMVGAALAFTNYREFRPSLWGKLSTVAQVVGAAATVVSLASPASWLAAASKVLLWLAAFWTVWSGIAYLHRGLSVALKLKTS